jgi:hypothetical protein
MNSKECKARRACLYLVFLVVCVTCLLTTAPSIGETHGTEWQRFSPQVKYVYLAGIYDSWSHISQGAMFKIVAESMNKRQTKEQTKEQIEQWREYLRNDLVISPFVKIIDCTAHRGMKSEQIFAIVQKWIDDHPQDWHVQMPELAMSALDDACKDHELALPK